MRTHYVLFVPIILFLFACPSKQNGTLEGTVVPPNANARITALQDGKAVSTTDAGVQDGRFTMSLPPGKYDVNVTASSSPFPMSFPGVVVESGKTTTLPPIALAPSVGTAVISGKISPGGTATRVALFYEGRERAAANTDTEGKYEFTGLTEGNYTVEASADGYAKDSVPLHLVPDQKAMQNVRLLYVSSIDGVDWNAGVIRVTGVGVPPRNAPNATISREMAKRAALADGQRNLLRIIDQIKISPNQDMKSLMGAKNYTERVQGFIQGFKVVAERDMGGGKIALDLELPLTGPGGLSSLIREF